MKATQLLHNLGQSIWLDNITRDLLDKGTLQQYIDEFSVTGLTSSPVIFDRAIQSDVTSVEPIRNRLMRGQSCEELFLGVALKDMARAAKLFRPIYERTNAVDGWVSLEMPPILSYNTEAIRHAAASLFTRTGCPNLFIKVPGTKEGLPAVEELIFAGIPVNVTLLFSREQYLAAAEAYLRGIERRLLAGLSANIASVASMFVSRWDTAVRGKVPPSMHNCLGLAMAMRIYAAARALSSSPRWLRIYNAGARPQRLLWGSMSPKDNVDSDVLRVKALAAPFTVNTMPEDTLQALARHTELGSILPPDGGDCEEVLSRFAEAGIDIHGLARNLQENGAKFSLKSWDNLVERSIAVNNMQERKSVN